MTILLTLDKHKWKKSNSIIIAVTIVAALCVLGCTITAVVTVMQCVRKKRKRRSLSGHLGQGSQKDVDCMKNPTSSPSNDLIENFAYGSAASQGKLRERSVLYENTSEILPKYVNREDLKHIKSSSTPEIVENIAYGVILT